MTINLAAGKPADPSILLNGKLVTAYYELRPDLSDPRQRVVFGTFGHRGSAMDVAFNEWHTLAITQAERSFVPLEASFILCHESPSWR